jgi:probable phosphoglycerate mutase
MLIVRHGESEWNALGKWQGDADPPLSDRGKQEAVLAARLIGAVDAIVSSHLQRAAATAWIIGEDIGVGPIEIEPRLREMAYGSWQGLTRAEIEAEWPGWVAEFRRPDDAEPLADALARFTGGLGAVAAVNPGNEVLVVAHGGVMRLLARELGAESMPLRNLCGYRLTVGVDGSLSIGEPVQLVADDAVFDTL